MHDVAVVAMDGVLPLDLGIPAQVFGPRPDTPYRARVVGAGGEVLAHGGFTIGTAAAGMDAVVAADTVVIAGYLPHDRPVPATVTGALRAAHGRGARMVSICTGAFALAAAGLLRGRPATTHWQHTADLAAADPTVQVRPDVLYVDDGDVLTSAGVCCGIDLCLHIVRRDLGVATANAVARGIVAPPHRDGGQVQYAPSAVGADDSGSLARTRAWARSRLADPVPVEEMARHAGLAPRTFTRRFHAETGLGPHAWLAGVRLDRARDLLENGDEPVDVVAARAGLGSAANMRAHFRRTLGTTPTAYRRTFRR